MGVYLKIEGIKGNVTEKGHSDWIECHSLQWGVGRAITSTVGAGKNRESSMPSISEITITKNMDDASPKLFEEACVGDGKKYIIHLTKTGEGAEVYTEFELEDCMISGYSQSSGGDRPVESVSLSFSKITMKYTPFDDKNKKGTPVSAGYDLNKGTKV